MMGSVNARTREIGVFRALGFRRGHVTGLILIEAALASLLAGVLGYLAGMGLSYALLPFLASAGVSVSWTPALAGAAIGLAVVIGSLASLYPALHASRLDPTVALRAL
jgi:putative ABC transport system permease protein